jgi:hypothetical protein
MRRRLYHLHLWLWSLMRKAWKSCLQVADVLYTGRSRNLVFGHSRGREIRRKIHTPRLRKPTPSVPRRRRPTNTTKNPHHPGCCSLQREGLTVLPLSLRSPVSLSCCVCELLQNNSGSVGSPTWALPPKGVFETCCSLHSTGRPYPLPLWQPSRPPLVMGICRQRGQPQCSRMTRMTRMTRMISRLGLILFALRLKCTGAYRVWRALRAMIPHQSHRPCIPEEGKWLVRRLCH